MTSTLEAISRQLGRMSAAGAFATHNTCGTRSLHLSVEGLGRVSLPVAAASARKLCAIAQPARHGYRDETRLDGRVRDPWEIPAARLKIDARRWAKTLAPQLERIRRGLGLPARCRLRAELHNLLIYAPGQFFAPHRDSGKAPNMVGTLWCWRKRQRYSSARPQPEQSRRRICAGSRGCPQRSERTCFSAPSCPTGRDGGYAG